VAELRADEARRRGVDGQLGEELQQVDLAFVAPVGDHPPYFVLDRRRVTLHLLAAQCGVVQHLLAALRAGVENHALPEDRRHERVRLAWSRFLSAAREEKSLAA